MSGSNIAAEDTEDWRQARTEIGAVSARVTAIEGGLNKIENQFSALQRDVTAGFATQAENFSAQLRDINTGFQRQAQENASQLRDLGAALAGQSEKVAAGKNINIYSFLATGLGIVAALGAIGMAFLNPVERDVGDIKKDISHFAESALRKDDFRDFVASTNGWISSLRDRQRADEDNAVTQRQIGEIKERFDDHNRLSDAAVEKRIERIEKQIDALDATKR